MPGMNRNTGRAIDLWGHILQSIGDILTTRLKTRVQRRFYGSELPGLVDRPANPDSVLTLYVEAAGAIAKWEPRVILRRIGLDAADNAGNAALSLELVLRADIENRRNAEVAL